MNETHSSQKEKSNREGRKIEKGQEREGEEGKWDRGDKD